MIAKGKQYRTTTFMTNPLNLFGDYMLIKILLKSIQRYYWAALKN